MALYIARSIFHLARLLYVRPETFGPYYVRSAHTVYMCFVIYHGTNSVLCHLQHKLVFITENRSVYCAVRTGSLSSLPFAFKGLKYSAHRAVGLYPCFLCFLENTAIVVDVLNSINCILNGETVTCLSEVGAVFRSILFFCGATTQLGPRPPHFTFLDRTLHTHTHTHLVGLLWKSDEHVAEAAYLQNTQ